MLIFCMEIKLMDNKILLNLNLKAILFKNVLFPFKIVLP